MPRKARIKSRSGIYHVMLRGINRQQIFIDNKDNEKFLLVLNDCKEISGFKLMAYCLMGNHLHFLIKEENEKLDQIIKRIGTRYVYWYNSKYNRVGHLFQDRYKSEPVDDDEYFLTALRYIHQNPVKAGVCKHASQYRWSSYRDYLESEGITDTVFGLSLFHEDVDKARELFIEFMSEEEKLDCLDIPDDMSRINDEKAREILLYKCGIKDVTDLEYISREKRNHCIAQLRECNLSIRQIARITGLSIGVIRNVRTENAGAQGDGSPVQKLI